MVSLALLCKARSMGGIDLLILPVNFQRGLSTMITIDCDPSEGAVDHFLNRSSTWRAHVLLLLTIMKKYVIRLSGC